MEHRVAYTRPYDAEVEYLEGGGAGRFILTNVRTNSIKKFTVRIAVKNTVSSTFYAIGSDGSRSNTRFGIGYSSQGKIQIRLGQYLNVTTFQPQVFNTITLDRTTGNYIIDDVEYSNGLTISDANTSTELFPLFRERDSADYLSGGTVMISSFIAYGAGNTVLVDMISVRVGQIGYMYDRVSGKLFGNKGTGNFSLGSDVANPIPNTRRVFLFDNKRFVVPCGLEEGVDYQRYDWLKGDGAAVINTNLYITDYRYVTLSITVRDFIVLSVVSYVLAAGAVTGSGYGFNFSVARPNTTLNYRITDGNNSVKNLCPLNGTHTIEIKDGGIYADNIFKTSDYEYNPLSSRVLGLFGNVYGSTQKGNGYISNFNIQSSVGNLNFTPCQLLRGIPASLDANGKARQAGECGMIDSISGKFYGNVAASGSFTVSND